MIEVHHLEQSRSHRVLWMLEELEVPYTLVTYRRLPSMLAPPELKAVHPLGRSPVIRDGDVTLAESGAILEYLAHRYDREGRLMPERGTEAWRRAIYFLHYAEGSLMPQLFLSLVLRKMSVLGLPARGFVRRNLEQHYAFLEGELEGREFLAGDALTVADVQMSYPLVAATARGGIDARYPRVLALLERYRARPALQRAIDKAGPLEAPG